MLGDIEVVGWLLIGSLAWGGYVSGNAPMQFGPFSSEAACEKAKQQLRDTKNGPVLDYHANLICVEQ